MSRGLLIITQVVDQDDPVLSFFHAWIEALAPSFEAIQVICLKEGRHALPGNVSVHSLGKEHGRSRLKYIWRFYRLSYGLRSRYQSVFIHMNEEYALLGGLFWRLARKRVFLWRNFHTGSWRTDLAAFWCTNVFCTSAASYTARYAKTVLMPVGVQLEARSGQHGIARVPSSILSLGRIAPVKRIEVLVDALALLAAEGVSYTADIYGDALPEDTDYRDALVQDVSARGLDGRIRFHAGIANRETPAVYAAHQLFVNLSPSGMYDKTIFEALAEGALALASSRDYAEAADPHLIFEEGSAASLAARLRALLEAPGEAREALRSEGRELAQAQSLTRLAGLLAARL